MDCSCFSQNYSIPFPLNALLQIHFCKENSIGSLAKVRRRLQNILADICLYILVVCKVPVESVPPNIRLRQLVHN